MQLSQKISIIIPTYNATKTLSIALESILEQTFTDYEILVIDGLSSDNTVDLAKSYKDERIKIISEKDTGIYDAMNKGIQLAKGEWLYFLGSDDRLYNNEVLKKVSQWFDQGCDMLYGNVIWGDTGEIYDGPFTLEKLVKEKNICHQAIFYQKAIFYQLDLFDISYTVHADYDFNIKCFASSIDIKYLDFIIAYFSVAGYSAMNKDEKFNKKKIALRIELFEDVIDVYNNHLRYKRISSNPLIKSILLIKRYFNQK